MSQAPLYHQIGHLTRLLHDTMGQLGVMPRLQAAAQGLPDARSRLNFVAEKTADAAHRVLNAVDAAKDDQRLLKTRAAELRQALKEAPGGLVPAAAVLAYLQESEALNAQLDAHLTDIMMAQDFHDLTGQVVRRVLEVAHSLEDGLVRLLVEAAPEAALQAGSEPAQLAGPVAAQPAGPVAAQEVAPESALQGPVVAGTRHGDVVTDQSEVDDLLSSLGF